MQTKTKEAPVGQHDDEFEPIELGSVSEETKGVGGRQFEILNGTPNNSMLA